MKEDEAKKLLTEHVKALTLILGETPVKTDSSEATKALEAARKGQKALRKTLLDRVKDLPVVTQIQQLGTAGTVAISAAAVTQADLAKDATEVFIAGIANDIVEERIEAPFFLDNFIDFYQLNDWGQVVMAEKISEAQAFVSEASEQPMTSSPSDDSVDTKPQPDASSPGNDDDKSSQKQTTEQSQEPKSEKQEIKENKPSQNKTVEKGADVNKANDLPIIETPIDSFDDNIKPHSSIRQVSPTS